MACESCGIMPPPMPARMRKKTRADQSQASILPSDPRAILATEIRYRVRGPNQPLSQPVEAMITVRTIPGAVRTQWTSYSSTRRLVITLGKISVVLEASIAKVTSPKPNKAVVSQRSRALKCDDGLACVSIASVFPYFCARIGSGRSTHHVPLTGSSLVDSPRRTRQCAHLRWGELVLSA